MSKASTMKPPTPKTSVEISSGANMSKTPAIKPPTPKSSISKTPTNQVATIRPGTRNGLLPHIPAIKYTIDIDVIMCTVCHDIFKAPRVLPCGHSLCHECLTSLILYTDSAKTKESFLCPSCRRLTKPRDSKMLKQRWAGQFPVNETIIRLLRNAAIRNPIDNSVHKAFCEICLVNNTTKPAVSYCNSCLENHCETCAKYHAKGDETRDHDVTSFVLPREDPVEKKESVPKIEKMRRIKTADDIHLSADNRVKMDTFARENGRLTPLAGHVVVAQTVTAMDSISEKPIIKLGHFNGKAPGDSATSDFKGAMFLTDTKLVLADSANKKIKVFDVAHKTRVELITDLTLRADPTHLCRVDANMFAVTTERQGTFHVRLFTVREKIQHFVQRTIDGVPLGVGYLQNTIVCSFLGKNALYKYKLTRAQQIKAGTIKQDSTGNDLFHHPGAVAAGLRDGNHVLYVADETEFGVTVAAINEKGDKMSTVFFDFSLPKSRASKRSANSAEQKSAKTNRTKSGKSVKRDDASDITATTNESELMGTQKAKASKQPVKRHQSKVKEKASPKATERSSGHHTFRRVDDYGRPVNDRKSAREIERTPLPQSLKSELTLDLETLNDTLDQTLPLKPTRHDSKAVERAKKRPIGKVAPQPSKESLLKESGRSNSTKQEMNSTATLDSTPNSTLGGTVGFAVPPKLVYRADSLAVDSRENVYMCVSSTNTVHQMSADGRVKRELLTDKDGILAPKVVCFSPKTDVLVVTCLKNNTVSLYRLKHV